MPPTQVNVDYVLFYWNEMKPTAVKSSVVLIRTQWAWIYLMLVKNAFIFVSHDAKKFVIHRSFFETNHEVMFFHKINYPITQRLHIKVKKFPLYELQWNNFWFIVLFYWKRLNNIAVQFWIRFFVTKPVIAFENYTEVERRAFLSVDFVRMGNFTFNILSQFNQCFAGKILKKTDVIEENFVCFNAILRLNPFW